MVGTCTFVPAFTISVLWQQHNGFGLSPKNQQDFLCRSISSEFPNIASSGFCRNVQGLGNHLMLIVILCNQIIPFSELLWQLLSLHYACDTPWTHLVGGFLEILHSKGKSLVIIGFPADCQFKVIQTHCRFLQSVILCRSLVIMTWQYEQNIFHVHNTEPSVYFVHFLTHLTD